MELKQVNMLALQTAYMRADTITQALCAALQPLWHDLGNMVDDVLIYPRIDELSGEVLDCLAWGFHVDGYDATAGDAEKRRMIHDSFTIHKYKGSIYAVKQIVAGVFGAQSDVTEWFEYGGKPYHFKVIVYCIDRGAGEADIQRAAELVNIGKNLRSVLDDITLVLIGVARIALASAAIQSETVTVYPLGGTT